MDDVATYLLVGVHASEAALVAGVATLGSNFSDLLLGATDCQCHVREQSKLEIVTYRLAKLPGLSFPWSDMLDDVKVMKCGSLFVWSCWLQCWLLCEAGDVVR